MLRLKSITIIKFTSCFILMLISGCNLVMHNVANSNTMNITFYSSPDTVARCLKIGAKINGFITQDADHSPEQRRIYFTKRGLDSSILITLNGDNEKTFLRMQFDNRENLLIDGWNKTIRHCRSTIP